MVYSATAGKGAKVKRMGSQGEIQTGGRAVSYQNGERLAVPFALKARSALELKAIIEMERTGVAFLSRRGRPGAQQIFSLAGLGAVTIGRGASCDLVVSDDREVSRTHAELALVGGDWTLTDDGLSRNGTFVNGARITQRKRLAAGDQLRFGNTVFEFHCPSDRSTAATASGSYVPTVASLTDTQRKILTALCRPRMSGGSFATPASNNEIAAEVCLGLDAVKNHLRILFQRFELADLPQNQKRARLVECALRWGLVSERDL
jgi:pSer/pThr/pTyr-binding forkhead associated (FHA) protein